MATNWTCYLWMRSPAERRLLESLLAEHPRHMTVSFKSLPYGEQAVVTFTYEALQNFMWYLLKNLREAQS